MFACPSVSLSALSVALGVIFSHFGELVFTDLETCFLAGYRGRDLRKDETRRCYKYSSHAYASEWQGPEEAMPQLALRR